MGTIKVDGISDLTIVVDNNVVYSNAGVPTTSEFSFRQTGPDNVARNFVGVLDAMVYLGPAHTVVRDSCLQQRNAQLDETYVEFKLSSDAYEAAQISVEQFFNMNPNFLTAPVWRDGYTPIADQFGVSY